MNEQTKHPMVVFREQLYDPPQLAEFRAILPPGLTAEAFARVVATAVNEKPDLLHFDRRSLFNALMRAAKDGLLPDGREGWILPHKENVQTQNGWVTRINATWTRSQVGDRKLIWSKSRIRLDAKVVYPGDEFDYQEGDEPHIIHKPHSNGHARSDDITCVYAIARDESGRIIGRDVMWKAEIDQIREIAKAKSGPWSNPTFYQEMALKTVIHHICKSLPTSHEVQFEPVELGRPEPIHLPMETRTSLAAEPAQELLPSPDDFPQALPGESMHKPDRSVGNVLDVLAGKEPVGMATPGGQEPEKQKRHRRTKAEIEADKARVAAALEAEKAKYQGDVQPGRNPDREIVGSGGGGGGGFNPLDVAKTEENYGTGGGGSGGNRVVLLDEDNRPYYQDTGEYLEETSQDYAHEDQEAKASKKDAGGQAVPAQEGKPAAGVAQGTQGAGGGHTAPASTNINAASKNGGGALSKDEQESYAFLREMTDSIKGRPLADKQQYLDFIERWLEQAGDNGNKYQGVRNFVGSTSGGSIFGVTTDDLRTVAVRVQENRKRGN